MEAIIEALFTNLSANLHNPNSLQAVLAGIGASILICAPLILKKSTPAGIASAVLGITFCIAPVLLPSPSLATVSLKPTDFNGVWRLIEDKDFIFDWSVSSIREDGELIGSIYIRSCPAGSACVGCRFSMDGRYSKDSGNIKFTRRTGCGTNDQVYSASFKNTELASEVFTAPGGNYWFTLARVQ